MGGVLPTAAMNILQAGLDAQQRNDQIRAQQAAQQAQLAARQAQEVLRQEQLAAQGVDAQWQVDQIRQAQQIDERQRRDRLRRALATQRARFGAEGIGTGGSAQAVLAGLAAEAERENSDDRAMATARINRINDQYDWKRRKFVLETPRANLLEASRPKNQSNFNLLRGALRTLSLLEN